MQISEIAKKTVQRYTDYCCLTDGCGINQQWMEELIQSAIDEAAGETTQKLLMVARHLSTSCGDLHDLVVVISQIICDREINRPDERSK